MTLRWIVADELTCDELTCDELTWIRNYYMTVQVHVYLYSLHCMRDIIEGGDNKNMRVLLLKIKYIKNSTKNLCLFRWPILSCRIFIFFKEFILAFQLYTCRSALITCKRPNILTSTVFVKKCMVLRLCLSRRIKM